MVLLLETRCYPDRAATSNSTKSSGGPGRSETRQGFDLPASWRADGIKAHVIVFAAQQYLLTQPLTPTFLSAER